MRLPLFCIKEIIMEKTIKIDSKTSIKVSNNIGWMMAYRDQFGQDIVPTLIPILNAGLDIAIEVAKNAEGEATALDVIKALDSDVIRDSLYDMAGLEFVDIINIVWAMAKAADDDIEEPREWVKSLPAFPVDIIFPIILELVLRCMVSTKNLRRLQTAMEGLRPSPSSQS